MKTTFKYCLLCLLLLLSVVIFSQTDSLRIDNDSINLSMLEDYTNRLAEIEEQRGIDSIKKVELEAQYLELKTTDNLQKEDLLQQLKTINEQEDQRILDKKARIDALRNTAKGHLIVGPMKDSLFVVYSKIASSTPQERAKNISAKIKTLYDDDFMQTDSIKVLHSENTYDIVYDQTIIMSISETDAMWYDKSSQELAIEYRDLIQQSIDFAKKENSWIKILLRIGLATLVLALAWLIIWLIGKGNTSLLTYIEVHKDKWLKSLSYKDYTLLTAEQEMTVVLMAVKILRWFMYALFLYITLPIIFSIFPFSRTWADTLFQLIWSPFKGVLVSVWNYMPKLFSILVIYIIMKYVIRFVKYIFGEIENEKLKISGFHADWAMPTFSIIKFLLYAFMGILIFPHLPGSDSDIFKGVSVFIGVLFSLGSSSAIANMIAGLVITYMRPFKIGDRIKIGDATGDILEKTLLVTRIQTAKNEVITIPNSTVLNVNTINYSTGAIENGLIIHTTVTIGYNIHWKDVHQALIDAALKTSLIQTEPQPFVLQTSLDDFAVSYQINAYTKAVAKQAITYSNLHQNIQDVCNERGIEIMSPHYLADRDGNASTIPVSYRNKNQEANETAKESAQDT